MFGMVIQMEAFLLDIEAGFDPASHSCPKNSEREKANSNDLL